ncbi:hypothetical protein FGG08_006973 [Glutinoglossum americanum]|uniref:Rad4-domain-containing protein n=1 Tax=Glutinoglossum americanum TaxID=1670608 RepID=A0A9P8HV73_9PEZI|nr:hypothetical protein FGG08_006973 [Glutinoglossum americanum]
MPPFVPRKRRRGLSPMPERATPKRSEQKPTLFDTLDAKPKGRTLEDNKAFFGSLSTEPSCSDSSDIEAPKAGSSGCQRVEDAEEEDEEDEEEDEEEVDWEDAMEYTAPIQGGEPSGDLELTIEKNLRLPLVGAGSKKKGPSKIERHIRMQTHCMHVQFLLYHNLIRNAWVCDREVQLILVAQLTSGVRAEWERCRAAIGVGSALEGACEGLEAAQPERGSGRGRGGKGKVENQREWGGHAVKVGVEPSDSIISDPLVRFLRVLTAFWKKRFRICAPGLRKRGYQALSVLESEISSFQDDPYDPKVCGERVRDIREFRELARKCEGSRDVGAQLFTALLKGLGLESRLVASLQTLGFGWSKAEDAVVKKREELSDVHMGSAGWDEAGENSGKDSMHYESGDQNRGGVANGKARGDPTPPLKRAGKYRGRRDMSTEVLDSSGGRDSEDDDGNLNKNTKQLATARIHSSVDADLAFPTYWSEVFSPASKRYIPVDALVLRVIATKPDSLTSFEPRGAKAEKAKQVISYVVSYSSDNTAKDVTVRYLKRHIWPGKTKGFRIPVEKIPVYNSKGKVKRHDEFDWFKSVMGLYGRPADKRTWIDDLEEEDLRPANPVREVKAKGETLQGYKNSSEFILERHLHREEAIIPGRKHVNIFTTGKGEKAKEEKVYRRSDVASCKTSESWHKEGREIREGEQPIKLVPMRAVTLTRKREIEQAEADGGGKVMQGLYSRDQTQWIVPPPIVDGVIPKNAFGNMDCYVPSMVPEGAVHVRLRGTARIARKLGIDCAEAVIGFEFGSQRAVPIIEGVVVAAENEHVLVDAWREAEEERRRKEDGKRERIALGTWRKFLMGLRIIERVREEYGGSLDEGLVGEVNPFINRRKRDDLQRNARSEGEIPIKDAASTDQDGELSGGLFRKDTKSIENGGGDEGGGFILEDSSLPIGRADPLVSSTSKQAPISLVSLHRKTARGELDTSSSEGEGSEEPESISSSRENPQEAAVVKLVRGDVSKAPRSNRGTSSVSRAGGVKARGPSTTPRTNSRAPQKPREGDSDHSSQASDDPPSSSDYRSDPRIPTVLGINPSSSSPRQQTRREVLPRRAAPQTFRSSYFEVSDEDELDGGPDKKRRRRRF